MPTFHLNTGNSHRSLESLSSFTQGYIEAMFFTNCDTVDDEEDRANRLGLSRLTKASLKAISRDCESFLSTLMPDGCFAQQWIDRAEGYDTEQAGRDFWFTRQGHGVGFWDREELKAHGIGEALTKVARSFGEAYPEFYRGWIYYR